MCCFFAALVFFGPRLGFLVLLAAGPTAGEPLRLQLLTFPGWSA